MQADSPCAPLNAPPGCGQIGAFGADCAVSGLTSLEPVSERALFARPNPSSRGSELKLTGAVPMETLRLTILDAGGRRIRSMVMEAGAHGEANWVWDGRAAGGRLVAPGVYFARVEGRTTRIGATLIVVR